MKRLLAIVCLLFLAFSASADRVKVRLFSNNSIDLINISFDLGNYDIYGADSLLIEAAVGNDKSVELIPDGRKVHVVINGEEKRVPVQNGLVVLNTAEGDEIVIYAGNDRPEITVHPLPGNENEYHYYGVKKIARF